MKQAVDAGKTTKEAFADMSMAAEDGVVATIAMLATKGRASYLGERSVGHQDPGATSVYLMLKAASIL
jgi:dihydroxyacetone kinase-like protein